MTKREAVEAGGTLQEHVARTIRNEIEAGTLREGEALPSTRALAAQLGVSVYTVNAAMGDLAKDGLIENVSRSRRIVRAGIMPKPAASERPQPRAYLVGGYAGSGKSEFGRIMARLTGSPIIDKDTITRPVVETALEALGQPAHDRDSPVYLEHVRPREYEALMATALENAECAVGSIVTAPFLREFADAAWIERTRAQFEVFGLGVSLIWVECDVPTMNTYLRKRGAARDSAKLADWNSYLAGIDVDFRPPAEHSVISNSASSEPLHSQAAALLTSRG